MIDAQAEFTVRPIGLIHTPFADSPGMPIQAARSEAVGRVEVYAEYVPGLADLNGFSHVILVYWFHRAGDFSLAVRPFLDDRSHGLFATRYPTRPNPIGLSVVELVAVEGGALHVRGVDMLDETPLLDIKPFVAAFDHREDVRVGWLTGRV
ncbi:MAG: tRNA (N6-threonylcarbamoyladenosine(37)-N6)-methyltransferase TrmO [Chloroflexi bacterium]|nr:MAG: tRNA (N6-threonylcarbamoyladenosine(37)-N6)-methyltransferase TrmO [Anaerolineaceae bacterium 4572_32.2]RLC75730.1 MAG: tRNA (N6-threonylcarbamoyladenosine(37)-N6)-methyltransferase TrmO [Chloroflexota bacterium]RLC80612.1 MAG: tRNA (N6-threonylcarbamoyladenosine(37)-N6)-methyltransferase TrmO [Chloroflexota bacterium]HEY72214.1 tRNA (N6-threonylcarbamoyladenosine(37)-N6)-methyltransferase TrmO [Thermoflexia bacterium]